MNKIQAIIVTIKMVENHIMIDNSLQLMHYNNFEMININSIEKSSPSDQSQNNKCRCYLISNYMIIVLPTKI